MTEFPFQAPVLKELQNRGFIHQVTSPETLDKAFLESDPITYAGFDCTAESLHVGSLMPLMVMRILADHGFQTISVIGTGTTRIGDPSGKDESRPMISDGALFQNARGVEHSVRSVLEDDTIVRSNDDWLRDINWMDFLRDFGSLISVNTMLRLESVRNRIEKEEGMSFLEFNYSLFQAFDFLTLATEFGPDRPMVQIGGSDQWGNITMGTDLIRRKLGREAWGITTPLLTTSDGKKMGKSEKGAVWLNGPDSGFAHTFTDFDFWQFWRNVADADLARFLKLFTRQRSERVDEQMFDASAQTLNDLKKDLATVVTAIVRGNEAARISQETAAQVFEQNQLDENMPTFTIPISWEDRDLFVANLLKEAGLSSSLGDARRLMKNGGVRIDDEKVLSDFQLVRDKKTFKLSAGKKKHVRIEWGN